jgi:hypothetical protein
MNRRLACRILAEPGLQHIAQNHLVHLIGLEIGSLECSTDTNLAQFHGWYVRQCASIGTYRRPDGAHNHRIMHFNHYSLHFFLITLLTSSTATERSTGCWIMDALTYI